MRRALVLVVVSLPLALLAGCGGDRTLADRLGMGRNAPDEFQVVERAPLVLPPEYNLRPPEPGAPRPQEGTTSDRAERALTGRVQEPTAVTAGSQALLTQAGTDRADPDIRRTIAEESRGLAGLDEDRFWFILDFQRRAYARADETALDARAEARRLADAGIEVRTTQLGSEPILPPGETP
ncbi:MAG: DUF3035 domain-containing protein [Alphaproteobacteria bacterium]|jgi:hypothetical protein|nr:DUF3035 domain-containing protein [Alphaproteobacteria bacterium]